MTRQNGPALVLAAALLVAEAIAVLTWDSVWMVAAGATLFALALVGVDAWVSRLRAEWPSRQGVLMALAFLAACGMAAIGDPQLVAQVMPLLAGGAATPVLLRRNPDVRTT